MVLNNLIMGESLQVYSGISDFQADFKENQLENFELCRLIMIASL